MYLEDEDSRQEYVIQDTGLIWRGIRKISLNFKFDSAIIPDFMQGHIIVFVRHLGLSHNLNVTYWIALYIF